MSNDNVLDLAARRAQKLVENPQPEDDVEALINCSICQNKAFTIIVNKAPDASLPGFDVICTACDTIVDMSHEAE